MFVIFQKLKDCGQKSLSNVVHSLITSILSLELIQHPKLNGCLRYLVSQVGAPVTSTCFDTFHTVSELVGFKSDKFDLFGLILYIDYVRDKNPKLLDEAEERL